MTALADDEIITEIRVSAADKSSYAKFPHPASRFGAHAGKGMTREGILGLYKS